LLVLLLLDAFYEANRCCREGMDGTFSSLRQALAAIW
jgi:hypothetical protein